MKCPTCGAENEPTNRFCEQCGSRITPSGEFQPAQASSLASAPTAAAATCPSCGAAVLPGEAFCDECGAALTNVVPATAPASANDAPTILAQPAPSMGSAPDNNHGTICPSCGHQNLPGDRFCDNCGAELTPPSKNAAPAAEVPIVTEQQPQAQAQTGQAIVDANATTAEQPGVAPLPDTSAAPTGGPSTGADAIAQYDADKQRLTDEIARQQKIIEQFEQMQSMFGAATPPAVVQGLSDARDARARAEADIAALKPPAPPADPAEVARLTDEMARQQKIIEQFEQMQSMFGAATPPAVVQGLSDARDARARAEADLAALTGGTAAPAAAPASSAPEGASPPPPAAAPGSAGPSGAPEAAPVAAPATAEAPALETTPASSGPAVETPAPATPAPPPIAPPPPAAGPAAARLVMDDGRELALPADKPEIIVGREDPISGIFPEVDLTPYGGESGGVSRQHARLNNNNGQWTLTDLNSTNYTRVDGAKIEPNTPMPIASGAKLQFGRVAFTFRA